MIIDDRRKDKNTGECQTTLIIQDDGFRLMNNGGDYCLLQYSRVSDKIYLRKDIVEIGMSGLHRMFLLKD